MLKSPVPSQIGDGRTIRLPHAPTAICRPPLPQNHRLPSALAVRPTPAELQLRPSGASRSAAKPGPHRTPARQRQHTILSLVTMSAVAAASFASVHWWSEAGRDLEAAAGVASLLPRPADHAEVGKNTVVFLIRSTLLTLENANRTGNYAVLRDLSTPQFQLRNTVAGLAESFSDLRRRGVDLTSIAVVEPQLDKPAIPDAQRRLRLAGKLPNSPQPIAFDLEFLIVDGYWRLDAIAIRTMM